MLCFTTFAIVLCSVFRVHAQKLLGSVLDGSNQPLYNATVTLLNAKDSSLVKGSLTGTSGRYSFDKITAGIYLLAASYSGYKQAYSQAIVLSQNENKEAVILIFSEKITALNDVTVIARKPLFEQKIDRMVINVANNITASGSTILDVLERSPGILVDRQNNALSINGKDGVVVMINGKINHIPITSLVQMLASMPADNVEKVELITTPPANFDAEGNAGYINIVLKRNLQYGTNGSYILTLGYSKGPITSASGNINFRNGKWNVYSNYSFNRTNTLQTAFFSHASTSGNKYFQDNSRSERDPVEWVHDLRIGADYDVKKDLVAGVLVSIYDRGWDMTANNTSSVFANGVLDTLTTVYTKEDHPLKSFDVNMNLQKNLKEGKLSFNADYLDYKESNPVSYVNRYYDGNNSFRFEEQMRSNKNTPVRVWVGTIDLEKKLGKINFNMGVKATVSKFANAVQIEKLLSSGWTADPQLTATYFLNEDISAAYATADWALSGKTKMKAGLRFEYINSNLETATQKNIVDRHYGKLFPSLYLSHTINDLNSINVSYSRRITRPTFWNLAPFVIFIDPNTLFSGNSGLQPCITDNISFSYTVHRKIITLAYSYEASPITNFSPHVNAQTHKQTLSAENQKDRTSVNLSLSLPFDVTKWWSVQLNMNGAYQTLNGLYNNDVIRLTHANLFANMTQNFKLPKEFTLSLSGFYVSAGLFGLYQSNALGSLDFGIQKKLNDKKLSLRLNCGNMLNTIKSHFFVNEPSKNLVASGDILFSHPSFRLTFIHNFGSDKVKTKRDRTTGAEEEKDRLKM